MHGKDHSFRAIDISIPADVREICNGLAEAGETAFLVGGSIRDLLLGRKVTDWDIATSAVPERIQAIFRRTIPTGIAHGTVTVRLHGRSYEVTALRGDGAYSDGRRPDQVAFIRDIGEDLARRDFTINAIAFEPSTGLWFDPFQGREDLEKKVIRAVGDPGVRFTEDGLRPLRAARFASQLGFGVDEETLAAIPRCLETFRKVSAERIRIEVMKLLGGSHCRKGLEILRETGLLREICPELAETVGSSQNRYHRLDVWEHSLETCERLPGEDPLLRLAGLLHDIGKPVVRTYDEAKGDQVFYEHEEAGARITDLWMTRLTFSNEERERVVHLVRHHGYHYTAEWNDAAVRRFLRKVGPAALDDLFALRRADILARGTREEESLEILEELERRVGTEIERASALSVRDLAVDGNRLMTHLGLDPGPMVGALLDMLFEHVTDHPEDNIPDKLLDLARSLSDAAAERTARKKRG